MQIGNAVIDDETHTRGFYDYLASHAIISSRAAHDMHKFCHVTANQTITRECKAVTSEAFENLAHIDIYNIYAPLCKNHNLTALPKKTSVSFKFQTFLN